MNEIRILLTDAEMKALSVAVRNPQEWAENAVKEMCRRSMEELFSAEVARMVADPNVNEIPADMESVILAADVPTAEEAMSSDDASPVPGVRP